MEQLIHSAWSMLPFGLMLLAIAIGPIVAEKWWDSNRNKLFLTLLLSIPTAIMLAIGGMGAELHHQILGDYIPFIILLAALFIITGGIHLEGDIKAKPWVNTCFLAAGWVLASIMGTTGAAMLLIRPLIATNQQRKHVTHTILFFIALVANVGGLLTPLGDPPLFMLFLRGADFMWFMNLLPEWLFVGGMLLAIYFALDSYYYYKKEHWTAKSADAHEYQPLRLSGKINFVYLVGVILAVAFINPSFIPMMDNADASIFIHRMREIVLCVLILLSLYTTSRRVRFEKNKFSWMPITEVTILFLGIFVTMTPVLEYMREHAAQLALTEPSHFYYATGTLSSFLDNTPTAVVFHALALTLTPAEMAAMDTSLVAGVPEILLRAVSLGSVLFGAMTYIGNGPNFMVKAIAERRGVKMPSFFGYILKFSLIVLLPIYVLAQLIFL